MASQRNYQAELATEKKNHPERGKERSERNQARRKLIAQKGKASLAGLEAHHADGNTKNGKLSNLKAVKPATHNHGRGGAQGGKIKRR